MRTPSKTDFQKTAFPPSPLKAGTTFALRSNRKEGTKKRRPPVGAVVNIRVKLVHNFKPTLAFVTIVDPQYDGQGVLHVSQVTRARLDSLKDILHPGDIMTATVVESEDDPDASAFGYAFVSDDTFSVVILSDPELSFAFTASDKS